jgi:adenine/guanine phosphoribosyltransferase-like PRPP-binding protein
MFYRDRIVPAASLPHAPAPPYTDLYSLPLPDGDWLQLPLVPLPPAQTTAIASLCITECSFDLEDRLSTAMAHLARTLEPEVIVGVPTQGLVLAASVARKLGHGHYVPLSYSRKFWFDESLSIEVGSVTSPGPRKRVYLDPKLLDRVQGRRAVLIEDVISTGSTVLAVLSLLSRASVVVTGIVTGMQEALGWRQRLSANTPAPPVLSVLQAPLFHRSHGGWMPEALHV